ncbi:uncharacterized protein tmem176l.3a [Danio rerio]|uniref:Transmembrane protein 176l.3a n=2 Tax=Danio rerio TaxID=7955 RepID=A0A8M3AII8_DANRE|nr:uncharacterized protein tmem176l.3a [Danio rerio]XP_009290937.1 uncharacterized protein tmem176l.3a [Danio rerio]|eukprot:XP_009290936.1 uncharacterized protein tmem176l.3a [Danio rerio]
MSVTVSHGEGTMIITVSSNPKSKWPMLCQILGSLCYGPVCFVPEDMRETLSSTQRVFGIVQIIFAILNLMLGCFGLIFSFKSCDLFYSSNTFGGQCNDVRVLFILQLIVAISFCAMTAKSWCKRATPAKLVEDTKSETQRVGICTQSYSYFKSCNMTFAGTQDLKDKLTGTHKALGIVQIVVGVMNITVGFFGFGSSFLIGGVFLVIGIMCVLAVKFPSQRLLVILVFLNIVSAAMAISAVVLYSLDLAMGNNFSCYENYGYYSPNNGFRGNSFDNCLYYRNLSKIILGGLDIMMIMLSVLQLCVTISFCVLTGKVLCNKSEDGEILEDPELKKGLLEDAIATIA